MSDKPIEIIKQPRVHMLALLNGLTTEQLNEVPAGFNNNIAWNLAHMISAQQGICYARAGLAPIVDDKFYTPYRPGTKPANFLEADEINEIKELLISSIDQLEVDQHNQIFGNYIPFTTRYGVALSNIDEAINFLPFHDGMHIGVIIALSKLVTK